MHPTFKRLGDALVAKGVSIEGPSDIAHALNTSPQNANNWKSRGVSKEAILAVEQKYGVRSQYISRGELPMFVNGSLGGAGRSGLPVGVPVIGEARLGLSEVIEMHRFERGAAGYLTILPETEDDYALQCFGDSMFPEIRSGQFVVIRPHRQVKLKDWVLCETEKGQRMIKIFSKEKDGWIVLDSINGSAQPQITFDQGEIRPLQFAAGPFKDSEFVSTSA